MNLKKKALGVFAVAALSMSLAAPVVTAQYAGDPTGNNTAAVSVNVVSGGVFDVFFASTEFSLNQVTLDAQNHTGLAEGSLTIKYEDTKADRPAFNVTLTSSRFSNSEAPNSGNPNMQIPAANFHVTNTGDSMNQGQWDSIAGGNVGDIGYFVDNAYVANTGPNKHPGDWTPGGNNLQEGATVQFGYAGIGTISADGDVQVAVDVPGTTVGGEYTSTVKLTVVVGTEP